MNTQDAKQQRANLLVETEDVQVELTGLQNKAMNLANGLEEIAKKLRFNANLKPSSDDFSADFEIANRLTPNHQFMLDFAETASLIWKLKDVRQKLYNLALTKSQLQSGGASGGGFTTKVPFN